MDTKDLLQINDFGEGMNTDTSDALMSKSSYRLANNLRYITNTSENSGELHMIEGAEHYFRFEGETVVECTNLRDVEIYVTQADDNSYWAVYTKEANKDKKLVVKVPAKKNRVIGHKLSLVTRYEDEDNLKLYIADGYGPVLCVQLHVEGDDDRTVDINQITSYPSMKLTKPIFCGLIEGNIKPCVVSYSYQLYTKYGHQSEISPSTKLISLYKGATIANDAKRILGYLPDETTSKGVHIRINIQDTSSFDRIKIYRISYTEVGQLPSIECIQDRQLVDGDIDILDVGLQPLLVLTLEEYNAISGIHIIPKTIESKDDYMFAANIKNDESSFYAPEFDPTRAVHHNLITTDVITDINVTFPARYGQVGYSSDYIIRPKINNEAEFRTLHNNIAYVGGEEQYFDMSEYIDVLPNDVKSYENSKVSYMFKSLRRGEVYKFGIVLYNEDGIASPVYHYEDICVEDVPENIFELKNLSGTSDVPKDLVMHPVGIEFKIDEDLLPEDTKYYEIVRCSRSINDVLTVAQGVLSRPICKSYEFGTDKKRAFPLTPTGFITTYDVVKTIPGGTNVVENAYYYASTNATNYGDFDGNADTFLFISPEYCYLEDTIKDSLKGCELELRPVAFLTPIKDYANNKKTVQGDVNVTFYNFGNEYANVPIRYNRIDFRYVSDTLLAYYNDNSSEEKAEKTDLFDENPNRYQYCKLYLSATDDKTNKTYDVSSIAFPETLGWDDFATSTDEEYQCKYADKVTAIGGKNYVNWVVGHSYGATWQYPRYPDTDENGNDNNGYDNPDNLKQWSHEVLGPGGKCFVVKIDTNELATNENNHPDEYIGTYLCNLIKKQSTANTSTDEQTKQAIYRSFGDVFEKKGGIKYHPIFNGDCYVNVFEYVAQHKFAHPTSKYYRTSCNIYAIPVETSVNLAYTSGYEFSKELNNSSGNITYIQDKISNVNGIFGQDRPLYSYNSVYSATDTSRTLISKEKFDDSNDLQNTDYRVYHSLLKTNNESVDNWLKYQPANFLDVDTRHGAITGLRKFKNYLIFWQECATGLLSVNERSMISDDSNLPLILGSGGVLTRFDYITSQNGMHIDDYSDVQSNTTLYWWDRINKTICGYAGGQDVVELSKVKFVLNYLNKNDAAEHPTLAYDDKFNEIIFNVVDGEFNESGSVTYNENIGKFTSIYGIKPEHKIELPERVLLTTDKDVYLWNHLGSDGLANGFYDHVLTPYLKYVVNAQSVYTKVFDNGEFAGRVYGGDDLSNLTLKFSTPLKQYSELDGSLITNREYNFRYSIPRNFGENGEPAIYGDRLRGKTMQCELESDSNSYDFSLQFIMNKFRISWS